MKKLLVTGGAGFIGSNFIQYILDKQQGLPMMLVVRNTSGSRMLRSTWLSAAKWTTVSKSYSANS